MSVEATPPRQFMGVTPDAAPAGNTSQVVPVARVPLSTTDDRLYPALEGAGAKCKSTYMIRIFKIRECLFKCCGTEGAGSRKSICPWFCKAKSIKYTSSCCSALTTFVKGLLTCGYYCYQDCNGCLEDQKKLSPSVTPT